MKRIVLLIFVTVLFCCKSEKSQETNVRTNEPKQEFTVKLSFKTNKTDMFSFVLYNIEMDEFQKKWIQINQTVEESETISSIVANFQNNISRNFRINLGNKEEKEIEIESIELKYGEKNIVILPNELDKYFKFNEFVTQDTITNKLIIKKVGQKLQPIMYIEKKYLTEIRNSK
jgi:hypothetical protein|tara:strand:- start:13745 stop:14263 length:519 start_codon:yes stop_codon:yes gene_type:complete